MLYDTKSTPTEVCRAEFLCACPKHQTELWVSAVLGLFSPCTLLNYVIQPFEMPYSALSLNLAAVFHLCSGWTTAHWPQSSDEPLGEVSGWHQPAGMCNEERIKQDRQGLGRSGCIHAAGGGQWPARVSAWSTPLSHYSPPSGTHRDGVTPLIILDYAPWDSYTYQMDPPLLNVAGQWFPSFYLKHTLTCLSDPLKDGLRHLFQPLSFSPSLLFNLSICPFLLPYNHLAITLKVLHITF